MLWTLVAIILILSVAILSFLKKVIETCTKNPFVYPSDAEIDRALPVEIMEHMMTFVDPLALIRCRLVSKYWHHHAIKPSIERCVMDTYERLIKSSLSDIDFGQLSYGSLPAPSSNWMHNTTYPKHMMLRDRALAVKLGKDLLEIDMRDLRNVLKQLDERQTEAKKYIIKSIGRKTSVTHCHVFMTSDKYSEIRFQEQSVPGLQWDRIGRNTLVDIMFDFTDYFNRAKKAQREQTVYSVRELHRIKYFAGFVPLSTDIFFVLATIFGPLIAHDVLHSAFWPVLKLWLGPVTFLGVCIANYILLKDFALVKLPMASLVLFRRASTAFWIGFLILSAITYPYSSTYFALLGMGALLFVYLAASLDYSWRRNDSVELRRLLPDLIGLALVIGMNDWKVTVDSFNNCVIWFRLFYNTVCYAVLCLHLIVLNCLACISFYDRWEWRYLTAWDKGATRLLLNSYAFIVVITLYGPTWQGNHV